MNNTEPTLVDRFMQDILSAIENGYDEGTSNALPSLKKIISLSTYQNVLNVIGKYNASPNEPKEEK